MIETLDNTFQLIVLGACFVATLTRFVRSRSDEWLMMSGFYGCNLLALVYWLSYLVVFGKTPHYSNIPDIGWLACYVFLLMLMTSLDQRRAPSAPVPAAWIPVVVMVPCFLLFVSGGDVLLNVFDCAIVAAIGFFAVRGACAPEMPGPEGDWRFHAVILFGFAAQLAVWVTSCFWGAEAFTPYVASDLILTLAYALICSAAWKALP